MFWNGIILATRFWKIVYHRTRKIQRSVLELFVHELSVFRAFPRTGTRVNWATLFPIYFPTKLQKSCHVLFSIHKREQHALSKIYNDPIGGDRSIKNIGAVPSYVLIIYKPIHKNFINSREKIDVFQLRRSLILIISAHWSETFNDMKIFRSDNGKNFHRGKKKKRKDERVYREEIASLTKKKM